MKVYFLVWSILSISGLVHLRVIHIDSETPSCKQLIDKYDRAMAVTKPSLSSTFALKSWPDRTLPYVLDDKFTPSEKYTIEYSIEQLENATCVNWVPRSDEDNYVSIQTGGSGCYSHVGYSPLRGVHIMHLQSEVDGSTCVVPGVIAHEMLHCMGFIHEHTRPDRDEYIKVHWDNIEPQASVEFFRSAAVNEAPLPPVCNPNEDYTEFDDCYTGYKIQTLGTEYDYNSIMHYGEYDFSNNSKRTLSPKKDISADVAIGQRKGLSRGDVIKINRAYQCEDQKEVMMKANSFNFVDSFNKNIIINIHP